MAQIISIWWFLTTIMAFSSAKSVQSFHGYGIMGGELANITEFPHQVYIKIDGILYCGGSIISSRHILTAYKCLRNRTEDNAVVAATDDSKMGGEEYAVAEITRYPDLNIEIAVMKLAKEITFSDRAKPIALAGPKYRIKEGAELIASGWGGDFEDEKPSNRLRKVTISKLSDDNCKSTFPRIDLSLMFCAGGEEKKTCWFDEGGPLVAKTRKWNVLVGVTITDLCSGGYENDPSVFNKVSHFNKWIKEVVKQDLQSNE